MPPPHFPSKQSPVCDVTVMQHGHHHDVCDHPNPLPTPHTTGAIALHSAAGRTTLVGRGDAVDRNFCQGEQSIIKMETLSSETPGVPVPNADLADSASPVPQRRGKRTARDAALGPTREGNTSQGSQEESRAKRQRLNLSTKGSCKAHDSSCFFLRKLCNTVESDCFQSIWWGDDKNSIVIEETLFKTEVLGRTGPLHNLNIGCMKAFVRQLHLHGFFIVDSDLPTSASRAKFPAAGAASVCSEVLCYYNPNFKREYLLLLHRPNQTILLHQGWDQTAELEVTELDVSTVYAVGDRDPRYQVK
uniref:HSF-type DNA-binding domain-containing protein n=1 Tax=Phasianus colchicus TaxID=9054 RepID=A0A669PKA1_PHACC